VKSTLKDGGGSVMICGCMSAFETGNLVFMDYILTKGRYKTILEENLWCSGAKLGLKN
jgi:hypothetical protein